ncbi:gamma-butyrobetaine hydroxylase-like domain-containing protein [Pseudoalteromonas sp. SSM20]|uniref:gamma-butyrobetaine hydroxylase-like domain-containing protein n=1 Tax=Pseudoalteromonas sp. SSM20 TaxID=3139394 RepID=UPI003BAAE264
MLVTKLHYHRISKQLDVHFDHQHIATLSAEFLRVHSPSAEVQGHGNAILVTNKKDVAISAIEQVGHYAARIIFDDGHNTGLYSWDYLAHLAKNHDQLWQNYLATLKQKKASREALIPIKLTH